MFNQSCGCQGMNTNTCGCANAAQGCGCGMNPGMQGGCGDASINGCPRPQPLVAPRKVCVTNQITPVPQPIICPIECRRVNRCMHYPVFIPQYEQTFVTIPGNNLAGSMDSFGQFGAMDQTNQCGM